MERCNQCKKILFRKKNGQLVCPNGCSDNRERVAFNTVIDPMKDRRNEKQRFDPWRNAR